MNDQTPHRSGPQATDPATKSDARQRDPERAETVYNFHVQTHHNYYVHAGNTPILVHNAGHTGGINWSSKSVPTFGHTFSKHGSGIKKLEALKNTARNKNTPQGQWLSTDDEVAAMVRQQHTGDTAVRDVPMPDGLKGQVINPDGSIIAADGVRLVPRSFDKYKSVFPIKMDGAS